MTHSPTPTELLALRTAHAATSSKDASYDLVSTVVFALGSAQLLQSPETAAELARLRAERSPELETEQAALLAELIGDVQPARVPVLLALGESVRDRRVHDHTSQNEDWYCTNLTSFMGERMGPVLRRLLNSEAKAAQLAARVAELEAAAERAVGLPRYRDHFGDIWEERPGGGLQLIELFGANRRVAIGSQVQAEVVGRDWGPLEEIAPTNAVAALRRTLPHCDCYAVAGRSGARPGEHDPECLTVTARPASVEDPHDSPLYHSYRLGHDLPEAPRV